jgi:hypothetical protein
MAAIQASMNLLIFLNKNKNEITNQTRWGRHLCHLFDWRPWGLFLKHFPFSQILYFEVLNEV